jgi:hypothetical protein
VYLLETKKKIVDWNQELENNKLTREEKDKIEAKIN